MSYKEIEDSALNQLDEKFIQDTLANYDRYYDYNKIPDGPNKRSIINDIALDRIILEEDLRGKRCMGCGKSPKSNCECGKNSLVEDK